MRRLLSFEKIETRFHLHFVDYSFCTAHSFESLYGDIRRDIIEDSLARLATDIDLLLIHGPSRTVPTSESIEAMNQLQDEGQVQHIGVSNFSVEQMQEAIDASETPILTNQIEYHPFKDQSEVLEFCIENDIMLTAYSPVAKGRVMGNDTLQEIGVRYGKTEAQVALHWLLQQENVSAIPKAASREHREENLDVFDFRLSDDEMNQVFELQGGVLTRIRNLLGI